MEKQNMYLLLKDDEKTIVETAKEIENMNIDGYEIYSLARVDTSELIFDAEIRDTIYRILKGWRVPILFSYNKIRLINNIVRMYIKYG